MSEHEEVAAVAEKGDPKVLQHVVRSLRLRTGLKQREFGKASRVDQGNVSRYERGDVAPPEESLRRMAAAARVPWCLVVSMIRFYTALLSSADRGSLSLPASKPEAAPVERAALDSIEMAVIPYEVEEAVAEAEGPPPEEARREAVEICAALLPFPPAERRRLLGLSLRASRSWAVAEALAHASERAAADEVEEAQELAELALFVARRVPGEAERARTEGYCTGFLANVRRVATEFDEASEAFALGACAPGNLGRDLLPSAASRVEASKAGRTGYEPRFGRVRALLKANGRYSGRAAHLLSPYFHSIRGFNCLRLRARHTNVHSPATFAKPLRLNWRKPRTDLIQPLTGSTSPLRRL